MLLRNASLILSYVYVKLQSKYHLSVTERERRHRRYWEANQHRVEAVVCMLRHQAWYCHQQQVETRPFQVRGYLQTWWYRNHLILEVGRLAQRRMCRVIMHRRTERKDPQKILPRLPHIK